MSVRGFRVCFAVFPCGVSREVLWCDCRIFRSAVLPCPFFQTSNCRIVSFRSPPPHFFSPSLTSVLSTLRSVCIYPLPYPVPFLFHLISVCDHTPPCAPSCHRCRLLRVGSTPRFLLLIPAELGFTVQFPWRSLSASSDMRPFFFRDFLPHNRT